MLKKQFIKRAAAAALCAMSLMCIAPGAATAKSLWTDTSESMFADGKAAFVGDILTIIVSETTRASTESTSETSQSETMEGSTGTGILDKVFSAFGMTSSDQYAADGNTSTQGIFTTTISSEVVEVMPNGNLIIEARRSIVINEETQSVVLTGMVRTRDITSGNTIRSNQIANAQLSYTGRGPIARRQRPGILNKIFNWVF